MKTYCPSHGLVDPVCPHCPPTAKPPPLSVQDTPRTDAEFTGNENITPNVFRFARTLERELNEANARIAEFGDATAQLALYKAHYTKALEACEFMHDHDEQCRLGIGLGQSILNVGIPKLRDDRDRLLVLLSRWIAYCELHGINPSPLLTNTRRAVNPI